MPRFLDPRERRKHKLHTDHARLQEEHLAAVRSGRPSTVKGLLEEIEHAMTVRECKDCGHESQPVVERAAVEFEPDTVRCQHCASRSLSSPHGDAVVSCFRCSEAIDLAHDPHSRMTVYCIVDENPSEPPDTRVLYEYFAPPNAARIAHGSAKLIALLAPPETGELALCTSCREHAGRYLSEQEAEVAAEHSGDV